MSIIFKDNVFGRFFSIFVFKYLIQILFVILLSHCAKLATAVTTSTVSTTKTILKDYNLIFDSNGAIGSTPNARLIKEASVVVLPTAGSLSKTGYQFLGWAITNNATTGFTTYTMPASNVTLYAVWSTKSYILTFNINGGIGGDIIAAYNVNEAVTFPPNELKRFNYNFLGWAANNNEINVLNSYTMPAINTTLYAIWRQKSFTVVFNSNGGVGSIDTSWYDQNETVILPVVDTILRTGYTLVGWATSNTATNALNSYTMPANNTTLYAVWTPKRNITITFDANGATGRIPSAIQHQVYETTVSLPISSNLFKTGYILSGWSTSTTGTPVNNTYTVPPNNTTLYAIWTPAPMVVTANNSIFIIKADGTLWVTGINTNGQLGIGNTNNQNLLIQSKFTTNEGITISNLINIASVVTYNGSTLALRQDGTVWATGLNINGQLGIGNTNNQNIFVQAVSRINGTTSAITDVASIIIVDDSTFAIKRDGTVWATGLNINGQLGIGSNFNQNIFTEVLSTVNGISFPITRVASIVSSNGSTLLLKTDGTVWATGINNNGTLGFGDTIDRNTCFLVDDNIASISSHLFSTLVLKNNNIVWGTGVNNNDVISNSSGTLGIGNTISQTILQRAMFTSNGVVTYPSDIILAVTHLYSSFALKQDGTLWATGFNNNGQLGVGNTSNQVTFIQTMSTVGGTTTPLTNVISVVTHSSSTFALKTDGTVWTTGLNNNSQLGIGNTNNQNTFVQAVSRINSTTSPLTNVASIVTTNGSTFAIKTDGTLWTTNSTTNTFTFVVTTQPIVLSTNSATITSTTTATSVGITLNDIASATATVTSGAHCTLPTATINSNGGFTINLTMNTGISNRNCTITFTESGGTTQTYTITQLGVSTITISATTTTIASTDTSAPITVTLSNIASVSAIVTTGGGYCTLPTAKINTSGLFNITLTANTSAATRTCVIVFSGAGATSQTYTITQSGAPTIGLSATTTTITALTGTSTILVTLQNLASATANVTNGAHCTLPKSTISMTGNFSINLSFNSGSASRTCTITFIGTGAISQTYTITQTGLALISLSATSTTIASSGSSSTIQVTLQNLTSATANVTSGAHCTLSTSVISASGNFTINITANTGISNRTCVITFSGTGAISQTYTITQSAP